MRHPYRPAAPANRIGNPTTRRPTSHRNGDFVMPDPALSRTVSRHGPEDNLLPGGPARLDLGLRKSEAYGLRDESPIEIYGWDWNESMAAGEAEVAGTLLLEVLKEGGNLSVSIDELRPA